MENPWNIDSIYDLQYFNCPSCIFRDHSKQEIINHAFEFHPNSIHYLDNIKDESLIDVICPWSVREIKKEESNLDGIDAVGLLIPQVQIKTEVDNFSEAIPKKDDFGISGDNLLLPDSNQDPLDKNKKITCKGCEQLFEINEILKHIKNRNCRQQYTLTDISHVKKLSKGHKNAYDKLYRKKYYEANKDKLKEGARKYHELNKDKSIGQNYICSLCGKSFTQAGTLRQHVKSIHEGIKKVRKKVVCDTCGKEFSGLYELKNHVKFVHEGVKDQECKYCGKLFGEKGTLRNHIKSIHEKLKEHSCEICGKSFNLLYELKEHIKTVHEKEGFKDVICNICGQGFKTTKYMKDHIKFVHDKIKDHKCQECEKAFVSANHLQIHVKSVHEKCRDFVCEICGMAFSRTDTKKRHVIRVHGKTKQLLTIL